MFMLHLLNVFSALEVFFIIGCYKMCFHQYNGVQHEGKSYNLLKSLTHKRTLCGHSLRERNLKSILMTEREPCWVPVVYFIIYHLFFKMKLAW